MKINHLQIQNFKGFENKEFHFDSNMNVLIGDNGSGKSSVLDAVAFVLGTFFLGVDGATPRALKEHEKRRLMVAANSLEIQLPFKISVNHTLNGKSYQWHRSTDKAIGGASSYKNARPLIDIAKQMTAAVRAGTPINLPLIAYYGTARLAREQHQKPAYKKQGSRLDGYYSALDSSSLRRKFLEWFKTLEDDKLKFNKNESLYNAFTNVITEMIPEWTKIHFSWSLDDLIGQLNNERWVSFNMLSDGYQNIIRLAADIAYRAITLNPHLGSQAITQTAGVVLVDEIDMHLHPSWQKRIIADLKRTFPNIQFIVTTHSPFIVQSLRTNELINLDCASGETPFTKSLEEITETEMQVEQPRRSQQFLNMQQLASDYFDLIQQGKTASTDETTQKIKQQLDEIELEFNQDPVFIALMKAERKTELK
ncbi:MAG: AAA family ATPase [Gammaproteobacteria bacterium]|nr:AAA family ATPase [Gammaproteobacteria bacterium]